MCGRAIWSQHSLWVWTPIDALVPGLPCMHIGSGAFAVAAGLQGQGAGFSNTQARSS